MEPTAQPQNPINTIPPQAPDKASTSGIIGTIIIIALIILGGLYFWGKRINTQREAREVLQQEQQSEQETAAIESVSNSDDTATLQAELDATQTSNLDAELQ